MPLNEMIDRAQLWNRSFFPSPAYKTKGKSAFLLG
jgi:hypothetical protein